MKIIEEIINLASDSSIGLGSILIKTQVLAHKLKNDSLKQWVNFELNGYPTKEIPEYRKQKSNILGTVSNGYQRANNYPIPLGHLPSEIREELNIFRIEASVSALEECISRDKGKMVRILPIELCSMISNGLDNGFVIEYAESRIDKSHVAQTLTSIRSKLLDFMLSLNDELGDEENISKDKIEESKDNIQSLFNSAIFGDNTTIIVGNHNKQNLDIKNIKKGNKGDLISELRKVKVPKEDIEELVTIIDVDNYGDKKYGDKVKNWIAKMTIKSLDGLWQISTGASGGILAEIISSYYGWK